MSKYNNKIITALLLCALLLPSQVFSQDSKIIKDVYLDGLQRVKDSVVLNILPFEIGDEFEQSLASSTIRNLYKTGSFQNVAILFENEKVYIKVVENPSIASIDFKGNKVFKDDALTEVLKNNGMFEGEVYRPSVADQLIKQMKRQYLNEGRYAAKVELKTSPLPRSRVAVEMLINEGEIAKIKKVTIIGNKHYSDKRLLSEFESRSSKGFNPFSTANRYSQARLTADIDRLRSLYQNAGFADFKIDSSRVSISPEKDGVFITLAVNEGVRYKVSQYSLNGRLIVGEDELLPLVAIKPQQYYSRDDVQETVDSIVARLANEGYSNARVVPVPEFNADSGEVSFSINVNPSKTVFVRRIELIGNDKTSGEVIRREMAQLEGAPLSTGLISESKRRLKRLVYIESVDVEMLPVANDENQVDLVVSLKESSSARISLGAGYSGDDGAIIQAEYKEDNFRGKGESLNFKIDNSSANKVVRFSHTNPYVTETGVSRTMGLNYSSRDTNRISTSAYLMDSFGLNLSYVFPLNRSTFFSLGGVAESVDLQSTQFSAPEIAEFIDENPNNDQFRLMSRLSFDTRDNLIAPSSGWNNYAGLEWAVPGSDLEYYKVDLNSTYYLPLTEKLTFKLSGKVGVGNGTGDSEVLPFFKNYYAGGTESVRGFKSRSLGPRDSSSSENPLGGSQSVLFNAALLLPAPGMDARSARVGLFVDAGQVFGSDEDMDSSEIRASGGVSLNWITPVGPLAISYAVPIKDQEGDELDKVQFTIGKFLD